MGCGGWVLLSYCHIGVKTAGDTGDILAWTMLITCFNLLRGIMD